MIQLKLLFIIFILTGYGVTAQDWAGVPVPANPGNGKVWKLVPHVSDNFNYAAPGSNKGATFNSKWKDSYVNG